MVVFRVYFVSGIFHKFITSFLSRKINNSSEINEFNIDIKYYHSDLLLRDKLLELVLLFEVVFYYLFFYKKIDAIIIRFVAKVQEASSSNMNDIIINVHTDWSRFINTKKTSNSFERATKVQNLYVSPFKSNNWCQVHPGYSIVIKKLSESRGDVLSYYFEVLNTPIQLLLFVRYFLNVLFFSYCALGMLPFQSKKLTPHASLMPCDEKLSQHVGFFGYLNFWLGSLKEKIKQNISWQGNWKSYYLNWDEKSKIGLFDEPIMLKSPVSSFVADPIIFQLHGDRYVFVEEIPTLSSIGVISVFKISDSYPEYLGIVLKENFHLSFPYVFQYGEDVFMIPETSHVKQLRLYKATAFPMKWEFVRVLFDDIIAIDPVVLIDQGRVNIVCTIDLFETNDHSSFLGVISSNDLIEGEFILSSLPIKYTPHGGRNAGIVETDKEILLVSQVQGYLAYGKGAFLSNLSRDYSGNIVLGSVRDLKFHHEGSKGFHSLSAKNGIIVYDQLF